MADPIDATTVLRGPEIANCDLNSTPGSCQALVPALHPTIPVRLLAYTARPPEGGPFCYVYLLSVAGVLRAYDLRAIGHDDDCWGAFPFVSAVSHTVKLCVNARGRQAGSGRVPLFFDTGLAATPAL